MLSESGGRGRRVCPGPAGQGSRPVPPSSAPLTQRTSPPQTWRGPADSRPCRPWPCPCGRPHVLALNTLLSGFPAAFPLPFRQTGRKDTKPDPSCQGKCRKNFPAPVAPAVSRRPCERVAKVGIVAGSPSGKSK